MYSINLRPRDVQWKLFGSFRREKDAKVAALDLHSGGLSTRVCYEAYDPTEPYRVFVLVDVNHG